MIQLNNPAAIRAYYVAQAAHPLCQFPKRSPLTDIRTPQGGTPQTATLCEYCRCWHYESAFPNQI